MRSLRRTNRRWLAVTVLLMCPSAAHAGNVEVTSVEMTVSDLARARGFYTGVLEFTPVSEREDAQRRSATLRLGEETLVLADPKAEGRPIPTGMPANDRLFQHIAIVVSDIDAAYARLVSHRVTVVSRSVQTLPERNFDAAGIRALYFRDPDGHFLELIQFPGNKGEPKWRRKEALRGRLFLGIDHTAIAVRDTRVSLRFYRDRIGLTMIGKSLNQGVEQDALSGVPGAQVEVTSLRGAKGPGVELLQYLQPGTAETVASVPAAEDALHWQINFEMPASRASAGDGLQRDPDGHALAVATLPDDAVPSTLLFEALRQHWPRYLMEGAQLGIFMFVTLYLTLVLEHPGSRLHRAITSALARRAVMGACIGATVIVLIYSDWGRLSGAHFNPAVTLAFLSLGRIEPWDAVFYIVAQFIGGWLGLALAAWPVRRAAAIAQVNHVVTQPGKRGVRVAFAAELLISFLILFSLLQVFHQPAWKPWIGVVAGLHLWAYITFESPLSGMSLNPARSLASAINAQDYEGLWIYVVAPPLGMLMAALVCRSWIGS